MNPENVKMAAIIGAGVMGQSISIVFASAEIDVTLVDVNEKVLSHAIKLIESSLNTLAHFGKISKAEIPSKLSRVHPSTDLREIVEDVDFVVCDGDSYFFAYLCFEACGCSCFCEVSSYF